MATTNYLRGFATVTYYAADHQAALKWYENLLGVAPYFNVPGYSEFRIGDYEHELGLIDAQYAPGGPATRPGGAVIYWHVDDIEAAVKNLLERGAREYEPITPRTHGFVTASVVDPFGNILGIMYNPHYVEVLGRTAKK